MPRDNRCMYMMQVCVYACCSDCVGVCWNVCGSVLQREHSGDGCLSISFKCESIVFVLS